MDGNVQALDFNHYIESLLRGDTGYEKADFNMDGLLEEVDFNVYSASTMSGAESQVP